MRNHLLLVSTAALLGSCDYSGDWLFAGQVEGVPGVYALTDEDVDLDFDGVSGEWEADDEDLDGDGAFGEREPRADEKYIIPRRVTSMDELRAATIYGEVGPSGSTELGGVTAAFLGTGGDVCVWVDPETAWWSQAVSPAPNEFGNYFSYPDNVFDDGDLDLYVGLSVYYTGSPGERMGDFFVSYTDSLGNEVPLQLSECTNTGFQGQLNAHAGRAMPEYCDVSNTQKDISYTIAMQTFSTPLDDDRLGYGLLVTEGTCDDLMATLRTSGEILDEGTEFRLEECLIQGESINPNKAKNGPWYGYAELGGEGAIWELSEEFEQHFCGTKRMSGFCKDEAEAQLTGEGAAGCAWNSLPDKDNRCYCGDMSDTPKGGSF